MLVEDGILGLHPGWQAQENLATLLKGHYFLRSFEEMFEENCRVFPLQLYPMPDNFTILTVLILYAHNK